MSAAQMVGLSLLWAVVAWFAGCLWAIYRNPFMTAQQLAPKAAAAFWVFLLLGLAIAWGLWLLL